MKTDIRWVQRLSNWTRALNRLSKFMERDGLNELEEQGLIQSFEYNHELAWKTQKDFLEFQLLHQKLTELAEKAVNE